MIMTETTCCWVRPQKINTATKHEQNLMDFTRTGSDAGTVVAITSSLKHRC